MPRSAGTVTVNFTAGTAQFLKDTQVASGAVKQFGQSSTSAMSGTRTAMVSASAGIRELEGNFGGATRAVSRFLVDTLKLGPALTAAFSVIGGLALLGVLEKIGEGIYKNIKASQEMGDKLKIAFGGLEDTLRSTNDGLRISNDNLENEIAKLEGKPQNGLKLALDDAIESANKLTASLEKSLEAAYNALKSNSPGAFAGMIQTLLGQNLPDVAAMLGGVGGAGGAMGRRRDIESTYQSQIEQLNLVQTGPALVHLPGVPEVSRADKEKSLIRQMYTEIQLEYISDADKVRKALETLNREVIIAPGVDLVKQQLQAALKDYDAQIKETQLSIQNAGLKGTAAGLRAGAGNDRLNQPFETEKAKLNAELEGLRAKGAAAGGTENQKMIADATAKYLEIVVRVNKSLKEQHSELTQAQKDYFALQSALIARQESDNKWIEKTTASVAATLGRVAAIKEMTGAIGKGYEAVRAATVQAQLDQEFAEQHARGFETDKERMEEAQRRAELVQIYDAEHLKSTSELLNKLNQQIQAEAALAVAETHGAEAARRMALEQKIHVETLGMLPAEAAKVAEAMKALFNDEEIVRIDKVIGKINEETNALKLQASALGSGSGGTSLAKEALKIREMVAQGNQGGIPAELRRYQSELSLDVQKSAERTSLELRNQLEDNARNLTYLQSQSAEYKQTLAYAIDLRVAENERLQLLVRMQLEQNNLRSGVRAFFLEMQESAKTSATIIYDSLNSAFSKLTDELSKAMTGQKTNWAKTFQELGGGIVKESLQSAAHTGLGAIAKHIPGLAGLANNDGSSESMAFWVKVSGKYGQYASHPMGPLPLPGTTPQNPIGLPQSNGPLGLGSLSGSGGGGGIWGALGSILGALIPHAEGGPTYPGQAYLVGERGPEPFIPNMNGTILSNALAQRTFGGGGGTNIFHIDARGTDPVLVAQRTQMAVEHAQLNATRSALRNQHEQHLRTPQRG